jgi:hypothetical protein
LGTLKNIRAKREKERKTRVEAELEKKRKLDETGKAIALRQKIAKRAKFNKKAQH